MDDERKIDDTEAISSASIVEDLNAIKDKMDGPSLRLLEEMIQACERNPSDQARAIERLLEKRVSDFDIEEEEVEE